jgi:hypothetical protein
MLNFQRPVVLRVATEIEGERPVALSVNRSAINEKFD